MRVRLPLLAALVAASAVSLVSIAGSAIAAQTPFKGTVEAHEMGQPIFPTIFLTREGTGTATHLGKYTEQITMQINIPTMSSTGSAIFTAANGDTLVASVVGQATLTADPAVLSIVEVYTITGGTGRFDAATGTFTLKSTLNRPTGASAGKFNGTIDLRP
jgi:hypothetical protein